MAEVKNWVLKVKEQKRLESGNVSMNTMLTGRKRDDGSYDSAMWIVVIINRSDDPKKATKWATPADYTGKYIEVDGNFSHSDWAKEGKGGKNFTIFANEVREHIFEDKGKGNGGGGGGEKY